MTEIRKVLLSRINDDDDPGSADRVRRLLDSKGTRLAGTKPSRNIVSETLHLWQMRLDNTKLTHLKIRGAKTLIDNLKRLSPEAEVEQFAFTGGELVGSVFFDCKTHKFLGETIVSRTDQRDAEFTWEQASGRLQTNSA